MDQTPHSQNASFKPVKIASLGLEPELKSLESYHDSANETVKNILVEINEKLRGFKLQFQINAPPTNLDIQMFIREPHYALNDNVLKEGSNAWYINKAQDLAVCYLIEQIRQSNSPHDTLKILRHTEVGNTPLFLDIFDSYLWRSVASMVVSGIDPSDYDRTLDDIAKRFDARLYGAYDYEQMCDILDLCAFYSTPLEQYFTYTAHSLRAYCFHAVSVRELIKCRLELILKPITILSKKSTDSWVNPGFEDEAVKWYHIPFTNLSIAQSLFYIIKDNIAGPVFYDRLRVSAVTPGNSYLTFREHMYWSSRGSGKIDFMCPIVDKGPVIVIPTLMLTVLLQHDKRRNNYIDMRRRLTKAKETWRSDDCEFHLERTLDETYFPGLNEKELLERNKDQIVSREYSSNHPDKPIIIVPQLWLWRFGSVLISAHGIPRLSEGFHREIPSDYIIQNQVRFYPISHCANSLNTRCAKYQMVWLISQYITSFGNTGITPLESTLSGCPSREEETSKEYISSNTELPPKELPILDYFERHVVRTLSRVKQYMGRAESTQIDFEKEKQFHHDLSDCRSELAMIRHILKQQREIINAFRFDIEKDSKLDQCKCKPEKNNADVASLKLLDECLLNLDKYEDKALKIDGDAERVEKIVQDLLNLKRTYTSAQDSHAGVLLGVAAGAFAIITIFFAPLAFLTALFALNIQGFERLRITNSPKELNADSHGSDPIYSGGKIAGILISSVILTFIITGSLMFAAMKWLNIDMKDLKFRQNNFEEEKDNPTEDQADKNSVKVPASTTDHGKDTGAPGTSSQKTNKAFLATTLSAVRKRLSKKNDLEAQ